MLWAYQLLSVSTSTLVPHAFKHYDTFVLSHVRSHHHHQEYKADSKPDIHPHHPSTFCYRDYLCRHSLSLGTGHGMYFPKTLAALQPRALYWLVPNYLVCISFLPGSQFDGNADMLKRLDGMIFSKG
jgi:hypothetical protein